MSTADEPEDISDVKYSCPSCGWTGRGKESNNLPGDNPRCPECAGPLERESES